MALPPSHIAEGSTKTKVSSEEGEAERGPPATLAAVMGSLVTAVMGPVRAKWGLPEE